MTRLLTADQLLQKLDNLKASTVPAIATAMELAALNVEGEAKKNCTPGSSPYYRAPYSDDNDPRRDPVHMRDTIKGTVEVQSTSVHGVVGTPKPYSLWVHEGTSRMQARPFILDAIIAKDKDTRAILSDALERALKAECE
jgi:HK97 gp10 family phage protein